MKKRLVFVAEIQALTRTTYLEATFGVTHSRQARPCVGLPRKHAVSLIFTGADFPQVLQPVVCLVAVDVVNLRRKPAVHYHPNHMVQSDCRVLAF